MEQHSGGVEKIHMCVIRPPKMAVLLLLDQILLHLHPTHVTDLPS